MAVDSRFYELLGPVSVTELAKLSGGNVHGDETVEVTGVSSAAQAAPGDLCYYDASRAPIDGDISPVAAACILKEDYAEAVPGGVIAITSPTPRYAHTVAASLVLRPRTWANSTAGSPAPNIHETAIVHPTAVISRGVAIGDRTTIGPNCYIGPGVQIGRDCEIGSGASLQCALVGNNVKVYAGARLGESGFGVMAGPAGAEDAPQYGRVILQDHVTVGTNTCIDRGAFEDTIIGERTKIDNLCQIAHNVVTGRNVVMASFVGISGSVTLGDGVMLGGRAGIADHVKIGDGAQIAAAAGVFRDIPAGETWGGLPARPIRQWMREVAWLDKQITGKRKPK